MRQPGSKLSDGRIPLHGVKCKPERKLRPRYGRQWSLKTDQRGWQPGFDDVEVEINEQGLPQGIWFEHGKLRYIADTAKPLSQFRISEGLRLSHLDGIPVARISRVEC